MAITFIKARSMSLTITCGPPSDVMNNPLSLSRDQVKLDCRSLYMNAKPNRESQPCKCHPNYLK